MKIYGHIFLIFLLSFTYMHFFTSGVPFFWDDHMFHESFDKSSMTDLFKRMFDLKENILDTTRPVYGLFFKGLFAIFKFNFYYYRLIKTLIFATTISLIFLLSCRIFNNLSYCWLVSSLILFNYPQFIHSFVFDEPYIITEMFKLIAILIFLHDFKREKSYWLSQVIIAICTLLAIRTYNPGGSLTFILIFFTLWQNKKYFSRYFLLFMFLLLITLPISGFFEGSKISGPHGFQFQQLSTILFTNWIEQSIAPIPKVASIFAFREMYYKTFSEILTFWGIWLIMLSFILLILKKFIPPSSNSPFKDSPRFFLRFFLIWFVWELPLLFSIPEPAIRYSSALFIPFYLFIFVFIAQADSVLRSKKFHTLICIIVLFIVLINISYSYVFRLGLGGYAIAQDKTAEFLQEIKEQSPNKNMLVIYPSSFIMDEFLALNKSSSGYDIQKNIKFLHYDKSIEQITQESLKDYEEIYLIFLKYPGLSDLYPFVPNASNDKLKLVGTFEGVGNSSFDKFNQKFRVFFDKPIFKEKYISQVYKYKKE